jgi:hypothetical protein
MACQQLPWVSSCGCSPAHVPQARFQACGGRRVHERIAGSPRAHGSKLRDKQRDQGVVTLTRRQGRHEWFLKTRISRIRYWLCDISNAKPQRFWRSNQFFITGANGELCLCRVQDSTAHSATFSNNDEGLHAATVVMM